MKHPQSLLSLVGFCLLTVLGAALAFAVIVAGGSVALAGRQNSEEAQNAPPLSPVPSGGSTFNGMITDSHCGARHVRTSHLGPAECARACVRNGASYVLVDGEHRYILTGGEDILGRLAGERVNITGTRQGQNILVSSAAPVF